MKGRLAILFQGTIRTDARVLRETLSFAKEWKVDVYASQVNDTDHELVPDNVQLFSYQLQSSWLNRNLFFAKQYRSVLAQIDAKAYDVFICIDYPTLAIGVELKKQNPSLRLMYDSHEIYIETINQFFPKKGWKAIYGLPLIYINQFFHRKREKLLVQHTDGIFTVCKSLQLYFQKRWNKPVELLRNCPMVEHFVEENSSTVTRAQLGLSMRDFVMIYQGDINPGRGLYFLIDVMKQLPSDIHLLIVGDGMLKGTLEQYAKGLQNVQFTGRVPYVDLHAYTRLADLGVNLIEPINDSKRLSLPNKLFEYMACGIPFLSNDLPEPRYIVEQFDTGYLTEMNDVRVVADKIQRLKEDESSRKDKGAKGKRYFLEQLNWSVEFDTFVKRINL